VFAHGVDLNIALAREELMELITDLGQRNGSHVFKEEKYT